MNGFGKNRNGWSLARRAPETDGGTDSGLFAAPPSSAAIFLTAIWFGLVTGLSEVGVRLVQQFWDFRVTLETIRTNHHWIWMAPVSQALIFGSCGLLLAVLARYWPRVVYRVASYILCFVAFLALLLTIQGMYLVACLVLAGGLAARIGSLIDIESTRFRRFVSISTPLFAVAIAVAAAIVSSHVVGSERRVNAKLPGARPAAPNILLIVMDNVRIDDLSLYGYNRKTTPNLARLARGAIRFDQARSAAPWTLPSHASMFTGRWPHELSTRVDKPLDATFPTLAGFFAGKGYRTAGFVANTYYCNSWYGIDRGFAHYEDFHENRVVTVGETLRSSALGLRMLTAIGLDSATPGAKTTRKNAAMIRTAAVDWLEKSSDRPYFVFLNYYDAHGPFQPPKGFDLRFGLSALPASARESLLRRYTRLRSQKNRPADAPAIVEQASQLLRDSYDSCIAYLDAEIGRLFAELEGRGLLDNTLVVVTSDHGEQFNEHQISGHGNSLYDSLIRVPLLIMPPTTSPAGRVVTAPVSLRSLAATIADLSGFGDAAPFPGQSLARLWQSQQEPVTADDPVLAEVEHQKKYHPNPYVPASLGPLQALVADHRVYIHNSNGREQLYDFEHDPGELNDLATAPDAAPILERFRRSLAGYIEN